MSDELIIRRTAVLRHRMLEKQRDAWREAIARDPTRPMLAPGFQVPAYDRRRSTKRVHTGVYRLPSGHGGVRNVARNSDSNERGFTIFKGHQVQHESGLERKVSLMLQADRTVVNLYSQKCRVPYKDEHGVRRTTVFDYVAIKADGWRVGVAVKMERYRKRMERMFEQIAETSDQPDIDEAVFYSNLQATRARTANARDILWAREEADEDEVQFLADALAGYSQVQFWELYGGYCIGDWGRKAAIWRLIDQGILVPDNEWRRVDDVTRLKINL